MLLFHFTVELGCFNGKSKEQSLALYDIIESMMLFLKSTNILVMKAERCFISGDTIISIHYPSKISISLCNMLRDL